MDIDWDGLRAAATETMQSAYAPYSNFPVGAAGLVDDGRIVVGCNVENAAYGVTLCAECGVVSALHASGGGRLVALACVDGAGVALMPCGRCRQVLWEAGGPDCLIDAVPEPLPMAELLPHAFGAGDLARVRPPVRRELPQVPAGLREYVGRGTVFVHADSVGGQRVWTGYWERSTGVDGQPAGILEEAPTWPEIGSALSWARARTGRIVVVDADGVTYWAGSGQAPPELPEWPDRTAGIEGTE
ncbi:cytidine deaminase [Rugosimonospora acidiphila]